jgi:uncharacterized protein
VLFGTSYYGMTQPFVAARRPPALLAFFANEICTDLYRHLVQFGGVPQLLFLDIWMGANFTEHQYDKRMSSERRALISHITNSRLHPLLEKTVHKNVNRMFSSFMAATPVEDVRRMYVDWLFDSKTRQTSTVPQEPAGMLGQIQVPFAVVQNLGYFNLHQYGSYDLFENAGTPDDQKWMIPGPPEYELPVYVWQGEALAFFDHILHGTRNGYTQQPRVRYWTDGTGTFSTATSFPRRTAPRCVSTSDQRAQTRPPTHSGQTQQRALTPGWECPSGCPCSAAWTTSPRSRWPSSSPAPATCCSRDR